MERLTIEKAGSILVKDLSGGYTSPCLGCESIGNCVSKKIQPCAIYRALEKLKKYEDLEEQNVPSGYSEWIVCMDRLPEDGETVLATDGKYVYLVEYDAELDAAFGEIDGIIAWQTPPKPYHP